MRRFFTCGSVRCSLNGLSFDCKHLMWNGKCSMKYVTLFSPLRTTWWHTRWWGAVYAHDEILRFIYYLYMAVALINTLTIDTWSLTTERSWCSSIKACITWYDDWVSYADFRMPWKRGIIASITRNHFAIMAEISLRLVFAAWKFVFDPESWHFTYRILMTISISGIHQFLCTSFIDCRF